MVLGRREEDGMMTIYGVPTDQEIDEAYSAVLVEEGDLGEDQAARATYERLAAAGWTEDPAEATFRCGVALFGWEWPDPDGPHGDLR